MYALKKVVFLKFKKGTFSDFKTFEQALSGLVVGM